MKVAILGYDTEGKVSYDYFAAQGHELTICDQNSGLRIPEGVPAVLGEKYLDNLNRFDLLVRTPGLLPHKILAKNPDVRAKITTQTNEFLKAAPTKNIIGVTGTKGKGTTSTLIAKMLEAARLDVHLGGNIGVPPLSFLDKLTPDSWAVLELSSFQLIDVQYSPHIAVCLMVVPEHLDNHTSLDEYYTAKSQLFAHQTSDDISIYFADNEDSKKIASSGQGHKISYFAPPGAMVENGTIRIGQTDICKTSELKLLGQHNWQNVCAAITAVWQVTQDVDALRSVLTTFSGLEHRLEFVRDVDGVKYYDDSFGTTPETAVVAIEAFSQPKAVILGGLDKGGDFTNLAQVVAKSNVRRVIIIGNSSNPNLKLSGPRIEAALKARGFKAITSLVRPGGATMTEAVQVAQAAVQSGDVVLLSPASSSFDMFHDYKDRGNQFKAAVQALA